MELENSYADPLMRDNHAHTAGANGSRRSPYEPDGLEFDGHGPPHTQTPAMIGWIPGAAEERMNEGSPTMHDPEATLIGETEPQIISPPIECDNPLQRNVYHTRDPEFEPNARHYRQRTPAQEYAREVSIR